MSDAYRVPKFVVIAFVWAIVEITILVGAGVLGYFSSPLNWPLLNAVWIIFGVAASVGYYLAEPEDVARALFLSQIIAIPLSFMLLLGVAPPASFQADRFAGDLPKFETSTFLVAGLWLFMTSMAGSFLGWVLNGFIGPSHRHRLG